MTNILNLPFLEGLYADYLRDPASVSPEWQSYFREYRNGEMETRPSPSRFSIFNPPREEVSSGELQDRVDSLTIIVPKRDTTIRQLANLAGVPIPP